MKESKEESNLTKQLMQNALMSSVWNISNLHLAKMFKSNDAAILISNLVSKDRYFAEMNKEYDGWFFSTVAKIENDTVCSERIQRKYIEKFKSLGLMDVEVRGIPPKRHFKIDYFALKALLSVNNCETYELITAKRKNQKLQNVAYINNIKKNNIKVEEEEENNNLFVTNAPQIGFGALTSTKKKEYISPDLFNKFWKLYPQRKNSTKSKALEAWNKLCKQPTKKRPKWKTIKKAIKEQKKSERWQQQPNLIPHHSSWLNGGKWIDSKESLGVIEDYSKKETTKLNNAFSRGTYRVTKESIKM